MHATLIPGRAAAMLFWPHYTSIFFLSPPPIHSYPFPLEYRGQAITHAPKSSHTPINVHLGRPCVGRSVISSTDTAGTSRSRPPADARLVIGTGALRLGSQVRGQQVTQMRAGGAATRRRVPAHLCLRFMYLYSNIQKQLAQDPPSQRPGLDKCPGTRGPRTVRGHCRCAGLFTAASAAPSPRGCQRRGGSSSS